MEEDLFRLSETMEREHGGRLRYATQEELDEAFGELLYFASEPRSVVAFYRELSALTSRVRCGHTRAFLGERDERALFSSRGAVPFEICLRGERAWITRSLDEAMSLAPGTEILAVDGITIAEMRRIAFSRMGSDGTIESGNREEFERRFGALFPLLVAPFPPTTDRFLVTVAGVDEPVEVSAISRAKYEDRRTPPANQPLIGLTIDDEGIGTLSIRAFADPGGTQSFPEELEECFVRLEEEGCGKLLLDLRGNGGGNDLYGALLVSHLADVPFRYFDRIEVSEGYEGMGDVVERDGSRLVTVHPGTQEQPLPEHVFGGEVVMLIDGGTFSTAADVATVVHHLELATLVGEESGGGYDGNTSGVSERITLPNSGIGVNVPCWMYVTANVGHDRRGRGAPPHHPVQSSIEDLLAGRDAAFEFARELLAGR